MYKLLLSWRYLKTRFIALASIVSVTLGVATLIVVNSVMAGFVDEMKDRLHGILSDVEIQSAGLGEIEGPELHVKEIKRIVGDDLEAVTYVVRAPALMSFNYRGRTWNQPVTLLGVDPETFGKVTDFNPYLLNTNKQSMVSFDLEEDGYDERLGEAGWTHRRTKAANEKQLMELLRQQQENERRRYENAQVNFQSETQEPVVEPETEKEPANLAFHPVPSKIPDVEKVLIEKANTLRESDHTNEFTMWETNRDDREVLTPEEMFDPANDQHTGIILGLAISNRKFVNAETGETEESFMLKPGDDVQLMMPTGGDATSAVVENCTLVDFYSSNMHEYDASFAFMPLKEMQKLRGMIDPLTGESTVSSIQIKVKEGANLSEIRDKLIARFPPTVFPYHIQTWQDTQRPLLAAVNMELTILNILLFMIIAVAGFGILATFFMIVVEKTKDIGILKALGAPSRGVMSIFLGYGLSLGAVGTGAGIALGLVFVYFINDIAAFIQVITGQEIFDPTIYYFSEIPTIVSPLMLVLVGLGAMAIAVLASVLPAMRAARLHPVEALRYE